MNLAGSYKTFAQEQEELRILRNTTGLIGIISLLIGVIILTIKSANVDIVTDEMLAVGSGILLDAALTINAIYLVHLKAPVRFVIYSLVLTVVLIGCVCAGIYLNLGLLLTMGIPVPLFTFCVCISATNDRHKEIVKTLVTTLNWKYSSRETVKNKKLNIHGQVRTQKHNVQCLSFDVTDERILYSIYNSEGVEICNFEQASLLTESEREVLILDIVEAMRKSFGPELLPLREAITITE